MTGLPGDIRHIAWDCGEAQVWALGATIHHVRFRLPDGTTAAPFAEAPWHDDPKTTGDESIPAHLRFLGGEWPCVPFGRSDADPVAHGFGTDNCWTVLHADETSARLAIDYPPDRPIERLERIVRAIAGEPALECRLDIVARRDCIVPVGLHPIARLPKPGGRIRIAGRFSHGETFPVVFEPGVSQLAPAARFADPGALPLADGRFAAFETVASATTEEAFQLFGVDGSMRVEWPDDGHALTIAWDPTAFPTCLFWLSAQGRTAPPWRGRFRGLGVEPLAARFEARGGQGAIAGGIALSAGQIWTTTYRLGAELL